MNSPRDRPRNTTSWPGGGISQRKRRAQAIGATSSGMPNASNIAIPTTVRYVPAYASQMPIIERLYARRQADGVGHIAKQDRILKAILPHPIADVVRHFNEGVLRRGEITSYQRNIEKNGGHNQESPNGAHL